MSEGGRGGLRGREGRTWDRDLVAPDLASRLLDLKAPRSENFLHESVVLGNKATVSAGCMVGQVRPSLYAKPLLLPLPWGRGQKRSRQHAVASWLMRAHGRGAAPRKKERGREIHASCSDRTAGWKAPKK